jgi:hypothetical protein
MTQSQSNQPSLGWLIAALLSFTLLVGCGPQNSDTPEEAAAPQPDAAEAVASANDAPAGSVWDPPVEDAAPAPATAAKPSESGSIWDAPAATDAASATQSSANSSGSIWDAPAGSKAASAPASDWTIPPPAPPADPAPQTGMPAYQAEVHRWLADFESDDFTPRHWPNSGATATIVEEDSGNKALAVTKPKDGVGAVVFELDAEAAEGATGLAFRFKGNNPDVLFEATVTLVNDDGKEFMIDSALRDTEYASKMNADEWQQSEIPLKLYRLDASSVSQIRKINFFFFGDATDQPMYLDDVAFTYDAADAVDLAPDFESAAAEAPRLFFSLEDLPALRAKIESSSTLKEVYSRLKKRADGFLELPSDPYTGVVVGDPPNTSVQGRILHSHVLATAFVGFIEDDPQYLEKAKAIYLSAAEQYDVVSLFNRSRMGLRVGDFALPVMIGYDWLNHLMDDEERLMAKRRLYEYGAWLHTFSPIEHWGQDGHERESSNWSPVGHAPLGLAALIIGNKPEWEALASRKIDGYLKHSIGPDGAPRESGGYLSLGSSGAYAYIKALKRERGIDLLDPHHEQLSGLVRYFANYLRPWGGGAMTISQGDAGPEKVSWFLQLGNELREPLTYGIYYRYYGDKAEYGGNGTYGVSSHDIHKAVAPFIILEWDDSVGVTLPTEAGLPLSEQFTSGQAIARTSWDDDAAVLHFKSDEIWGGWSHADDNTFGFFAHGDGILADPGAHYYYARQHNAVLIDGIGQGYKNPGHDTAGEIIRFEDKGDHVLMTGDATEAYAKFITGDPHLNVKKVLRHLCFIREPEPMLLILDEIEMNDGQEHDYSLMFQYGQRREASELVLDEGNRTVFAKTKQGGVKSMTRFLLPAGNLKIVERPDIENSVSTLEVTHRADKARFLTLVVPARIEDAFPEITSRFESPESGSIRIQFTEHPEIEIGLNGSDFILKSAAAE